MKKQDKNVEKAAKPTKSPEKAVATFRQILIETDGSQVVLRKSEVSKIELVSIMRMIIDHVSNTNDGLTKN